MRYLSPDQAELFFFFARGSPATPNTEKPGDRNQNVPKGDRRPLREACVAHANECQDQDNDVWQLLEPATDTRQAWLRSLGGNTRLIVRHKLAHCHQPAVIAVLSSP